MKVSCTVTINLRDHSDPDHPKPLPDDLSAEAIRDTVTRLLGIHDQGQLVLTTLYRVPRDEDSGYIEDVGGGLFVSAFSVSAAPTVSGKEKK